MNDRVWNELMTDYKIWLSWCMNMWMNTYGWGRRSRQESKCICDWLSEYTQETY